MVTGPSFTNDTSIIAPKVPVSTLMFSFLILSLNSSYSALASSGLAASIKFGLFPFLVSE